MLAPWMLALIPLLRWRLARGALVALAVVSVTVQVASVTYAFETEFIQHRDHATAPYDWVWRPEESHLLERFHNLARHVSGDPVPAFEDQPGAAPDVNVFPFKRAIRTQSAPVRYGLLAVWIAGVVMLVLVVVRWAWLVRRAEPPEESATVSSA
ncbi:MAG: hypothetical protein GY715_14075 [Planctomycetes bacterium]|nr:hypothetical protein [Planctomycetota bacterium]